MRDKIDNKLLEFVEQNSGSPVHTILGLARGLRSETQLRKRLNALDIQGYILLDRQSETGRVFAIITPFGKETLQEGRKEPATSEEMTVP
jgi:hypothetical protein